MVSWLHSVGVLIISKLSDKLIKSKYWQGSITVSPLMNFKSGTKEIVISDLFIFSLKKYLPLVVKIASPFAVILEYNPSLNVIISTRLSKSNLHFPSIKDLSIFFLLQPMRLMESRIKNSMFFIKISFIGWNLECALDEFFKLKCFWFRVNTKDSLSCWNETQI